MIATSSFSLSFSPSVMAMLGVIAVSLTSFLGILFFAVSEQKIRRALIYLVSISTGALFGDVFIHMIPELAEDAAFFPRAMMIVLGGIIFSFVVEKFIHWRHCHELPGEHCHDDGHHHHHHVGVMALLGETVHNAIDGIVVAAAFLVSPEVGLSTTIAVLFHEIPHEIGNFAVLLHSGFTRRRALMFNALAALSSIAGAVVVLVAGAYTESLEMFLLPFAAGNLLYIAGSDLIPELHRYTKPSQGLVQLLYMIVGIGLMYIMVLFE